MNFVRVLKGGLVGGWFSRLGSCVCVLGVRYELSLAFLGDSCKPTSSAISLSYLEPIWSLIANHCRKPIEGRQVHEHIWSLIEIGCTNL